MEVNYCEVVINSGIRNTLIYRMSTGFNSLIELIDEILFDNNI